MAKERRKATETEANALASGIRLRIIRLTYSEALTNKELAERLGRDPATTLHHVRKLVDAGFLAAQPSRRGARGSREIPYVSTGLSWRLDSTGTSGLPEAMLEAYLAEIAEIDIEQLRQTRLVVQVPADERAEFERRLGALLEEFHGRATGTSAVGTAVYIALYPGA